LKEQADVWVGISLMSLFEEDGYLRPDERSPKESPPRIKRSCAIALIVAVALPSSCVLLAVKDHRERPAKIKTFERVCQSFHSIDREGGKALEGLYQSASRGEIDERDITFSSGEYNSGFFEPFPYTVEGLSPAELRVQVSELLVKGRPLLTLREPELLLPNRIGVAAPANTIISCQRSEVLAISHKVLIASQAARNRH
jgi:hypothetical protein